MCTAPDPRGRRLTIPTVVDLAEEVAFAQRSTSTTIDRGSRPGGAGDGIGFAELPNGYARIGISRSPARRQRGYRLYRALAPGPWFRSVDADEFRRRYLAQLGELDPHAVLYELSTLAAGKVPALLCFEKPPPDPAPCHRALVSAWLSDTLGLEVVEVGHEQLGCGWRHPKLPVDWRRP